MLVQFASSLELHWHLQDLDIFLNSDIGILLGGLLGGQDGLLAKLKLLVGQS